PDPRALFEPRLLWPWVPVAATFAVVTGVALAVRRIAIALLERWPRGTHLIGTYLDAISGPSLLWCVVIGLYAANEVAIEFALLPRRLHGHLQMALEAAVILSVTFTLAGLAGRFIGRAGIQREMGVAVTGLAQTTARFAVMIVGVL